MTELYTDQENKNTTQTTKVRNEKNNIATTHRKTKIIIGEYCEKLSSSQLRNPRWNKQIPRRHKLSKPTQEDAEGLTRHNK